MPTIKVVGLDVALTHTGIAKGLYDTDTGAFSIEQVTMVVTENQRGKAKIVRQNSDDLRRCQEIFGALVLHCRGAEAVFSEVPTGAQSARAALSFGMVIGLLSGLTAMPGFSASFIQVLPQEVKLAIPGGSKTTSKEEIVHWAAETWPGAGWKQDAKGKFLIPGLGKLTADNEHMADAVAAINAGVRTPEFRNLLPAFRRIAA